MNKRLLTLLLAAAILLGLAFFAWATPPARQLRPVGAPPGGWTYCCNPPRFQIFQAPSPYGGLIMLDTKTGESWQRIIVNTPKGISIRWMKLERRGPGKGESILWQ